ncbi:MAG: DUF1289 domain-containing protein [Rhodobacterales bacterium]|nr:DUF1289 domain-containing protein [Rhodobacterales bacterium]
MNDFNGSEIWQRDEIQSPCTKICVIHPDAKLCIGCLRTTDEISGWSRMTPAAGSTLIAELPSRKPLLKNARRGGRDGRSRRRPR